MCVIGGFSFYVVNKDMELQLMLNDTRRIGKLFGDQKFKT